jgi:hypothetical protein
MKLALQGVTRAAISTMNVAREVSIAGTHAANARPSDCEKKTVFPRTGVDERFLILNI